MSDEYLPLKIPNKLHQLITCIQVALCPALQSSHSPDVNCSSCLSVLSYTSVNSMKERVTLGHLRQ